jgi:GT2 family glycosyltransferase
MSLVMDKIAIVILNWNGRKMLEQYLSGVVACSQYEAAVYVADNHSTDDSMAFLAEQFPEVRTITLDQNYGFAGGYNKALKQVEAEYYVLLNSDVEVTRNWLSPLVKYMDEHQEVAACQPKLLSYVDKGKFEYAGAAGGFIDRYGYPFCRGRLFETVEADNGQYDQVEQVLWATGACLFIRSADYWSVGGLDERFFAHNEEIDLCWRLNILGRQIVCLPDSVVYHLGGGTLPKGNPMKTFLNFRNNLTMLYKCLPDSELRHVMRWRWFLDYLAAAKMLLLEMNLGEFKAVFKARREFKKWRRQFEADRKRIQASREAPAVERKPFSLLWHYYVKGRKRFNELP